MPFIQRTDQRLRALEAARTRLESSQVEGEEVSGLFEQQPLRFRLLSSGWMIEAPAPPGPQALTVRPVMPQQLYPPQRMPRAELDDERFVHKFVVEGRPKQLVVEVLTEEVRDAIAQIEPTAVDVRNGTVTVKKLFVYYFAEPQMIAAAMGLVAQLVQNLATAVPKLFELVETVENVSGGALVPYREDRQVTTHSRRLKGEYVEELVPFQRTRQLRKLSRPYTTAIMSGLLIVVWVAEFLCGRA